MPARVLTMADEKIDNGAPVDWLAAIKPATKRELDDWVPTGLDDWVLTKCVIEILDDVRKRLIAGAEGSGATLTADECTTVLGCLKNPAPPNSRPPQDWYEKQAAIALIARYCLNLEKGEPLKVAVTMTAKHFDCSESKVRAARKALSWPYK
jgi:hypothetical protein